MNNKDHRYTAYFLYQFIKQRGILSSPKGHIRGCILKEPSRREISSGWLFLAQSINTTSLAFAIACVRV